MDELTSKRMEELFYQEKRRLDEETGRRMEALLALAEQDPEAQFQLGTIYNSFTFYVMPTRYKVTPEEVFGETGSQAEAQSSRTREELAKKWFRKAAEGGHIEAMFQLGNLYRKPFQENWEQAFCWYHRAAEQGNVKAQYIMFLAYSEGLGVPADRAEAAKWCVLAAEQGHEPARNKVRELYPQMLL